MFRVCILGVHSRLPPSNAWGTTWMLGLGPRSICARLGMNALSLLCEELGVLKDL